MKQYSDQELIDEWKRNKDRGIELIFKTYYTFVCHVLYRIIPDENTVEDIAQDVFFELWKKRTQIDFVTSLKAYLRRAARNRALNHIRDQRMAFAEESDMPALPTNDPTINQILAAEELKQQIDEAVDSLPERCRLVFVLSRFENMSYREIADNLDISIKTVEHQIAKALKSLRQALGPNLINCLLLITLFWR